LLWRPWLFPRFFGGFGGSFEGGGGWGALGARLTHFFAAAGGDALAFGRNVGVQTGFFSHYFFLGAFFLVLLAGIGLALPFLGIFMSP
jgi:hypothetical protein